MAADQNIEQDNAHDFRKRKSTLVQASMSQAINNNEKIMICNNQV